MGEAIDFRGGSHGLGAHGLLGGDVLDRFEAQAHPEKRRAQVMRGVGRHALRARQDPLELARGRVER